MPLAVVVNGRELRLDGLPLSAIDDVERSTGKTMRELVGTPAGLKALVGLLVEDATNLRLGEVVPASDDRPTEYLEGVPMNGRTADHFVVVFARPPFCWPPEVTRRQCLRDLLLIQEALEDAE